MADHLSALVLDELASGLPASGEAKAHAQACPQCQLRLEGLRAARQAAKGAPQFERVWAKVRHAPPEPERTSRWGWMAAPLGAMALAMLLVLVVPGGEPPNESRLKGTSSFRVLSAQGGQPISRANPGDRVVLAVGSAGHPYGLVLGVDESGAVSLVWPMGTFESGQVPSGPEARLDPPFEVTEGSLELFALFSDKPLELAVAQRAMEQAVEVAKREGKSPRQVTPPKLRGEAARANASLGVEARR